MSENHNPISPLGSALFDMIREMTEAQAKIYQRGGKQDEATIEIARLESLHRPKVLQAIKRQATASGVTFDAPRIEVDTAVAGGMKKKLFAHADKFWAKALADFAADTGSVSNEVTVPGGHSTYASSGGIL